MDTGSQALSAEFQRRLRAFVRRRVPTDADADDVVQDALTRLVRHGPPPSGSVHAWLFTVARNVIIDRGRTRRDHVDGLHEPRAGRERERDPALRVRSGGQALLRRLAG